MSKLTMRMVEAIRECATAAEGKWYNTDRRLARKAADIIEALLDAEADPLPVIVSEHAAVENEENTER